MRDSDARSYSSRPLLTVNLSALADNYKYLAALASPAKIGASVKADAYGLGIEQVGKALYGVGCRTFFVAHAGEGKILRNAIGRQPNIYVFSGPSPQDMSLFFGSILKPVINSLTQARDWIKSTHGMKRAPRTALHFDTGMNRLGIPDNEVEVFTKEDGLVEALDVDLVMSHLACAGVPSHPLNKSQLERFKRTAARMPMVSLSLANTGGIYLGKPYHFKLVRPGIGLFGGAATDTPTHEKTRPVIELHAPVLQIKNIKKGETLGYNALYTAPHDMKIAIVSAGYADGIPISLTGTDKAVITHARIGKENAPVVGRISMDYTILDITNVKKYVERGEKAIFFGSQLNTQAKQAGTISYEILTHLGQRCKRVYIRDAAGK